MSASTTNVALKHVRAVFEKAKLEGKIPLDPAGTIDNFPGRRARSLFTETLQRTSNAPYRHQRACYDFCYGNAELVCVLSGPP